MRRRRISSRYDPKAPSNRTYLLSAKRSFHGPQLKISDFISAVNYVARALSGVLGVRGHPSVRMTSIRSRRWGAIYTVGITRCRIRRHDAGQRRSWRPILKSVYLHLVTR